MEKTLVELTDKSLEILKNIIQETGVSISACLNASIETYNTLRNLQAESYKITAIKDDKIYNICIGQKTE